MDQLSAERLKVRVIRPRVRPNRLRQWFAKKPQPMTLKAFAEAIGVTPSYVSQLTSDNPPWPRRHVARAIGIVTRGYVTPNMLAGYSKRLLPPKD
jgi:hypothetical protein